MAARLITVDTSVTVPAFSAWHDAHAVASSAVSDVRRLPAHVIMETVATMSRLPGGLASSPRDVLAALRKDYPEPPLVLGAEQCWAPIEAVVGHRLRGGQVYDAVVATAAKVAGATLLSLDRRAEPTYRAVGVDYELLA